MISALSYIQKKLKAPKNQKNNFGNYTYRSAEDILEAVKPFLDGENEVSLTISDEVLLVGDRYYVKATATLSDKTGESVSATAYAREPLTKKGMDEAQITGSASSYARKYALNGLFAIDDTKDSDTDEYIKKTKVTSKEKTTSGLPIYDFNTSSVAQTKPISSMDKLRKKYFAIAYSLKIDKPSDYIVEKLKVTNFNDISESKLSAFVKALEMKQKNAK